MKYFFIGIVVTLAGIPLLSLNLYLGMVVIGAGAMISAWFKGDAMRVMQQKMMDKALKAKAARESRKGQ